MNETLISVEQLSLSFPNHLVLSDLSFKVHRGEFLGIIGENGVGKTTLVRLILEQLRHQPVKSTSSQVSKLATSLNFETWMLNTHYQLKILSR